MQFHTSKTIIIFAIFAQADFINLDILKISPSLVQVGKFKLSGIRVFLLKVETKIMICFSTLLGLAQTNQSELCLVSAHLHIFLSSTSIIISFLVFLLYYILVFLASDGTSWWHRFLIFYQRKLLNIGTVPTIKIRLY